MRRVIIRAGGMGGSEKVAGLLLSTKAPSACTNWVAIDVVVKELNL